MLSVNLSIITVYIVIITKSVEKVITYTKIDYARKCFYFKRNCVVRRKNRKQNKDKFSNILAFKNNSIRSVTTYKYSNL